MAAPKNLEKEALFVFDECKTLYSEARNGTLKREDLDSLTNTMGKCLKALAIAHLDRDRELAEKSLNWRMKALEHKP